MEDLEIRVVSRQDSRQVREICDFLAQYGLRYEGEIEFTVGAYRDDRLVGTGSLAGKVLRNLAVDESLQGQGVMAAIVTRLIEEQRKRGLFHYFIYTRPDKAALFEGLGFREIARATPHAAVLEMGLGSVEDYCKRVRQAAAKLPAGPRAALVVNCNPFTLGHQALIRRAAGESAAVIVFVVAEDKSLVPFPDRLELVREGTRELANVLVVSGEDYIISGATFPAYFTREEETATAQARLDATLFAARLAPQLGIARRFVGEEPYCAVTSAYNQALQEILPAHHISLSVVPRFAVEGEIVSASKVREMIRLDDWEGIQRMVPATTYAYLRSAKARDVIAKIKASHTRH
ncbi:MAG TPA: [citrate (pro-3S)-lyase] ligase [Selenomonadales bacterium]|nr:[citrate (pro-3S)-lyase] ligase [Selenomonadales bacterium]